MANKEGYMNALAEIKGDSLSRLLQLRASRYGITLKWTGRAIEDIDTLCQEYSSRKMFNQCIWDNGLRLLMDMPEFKDLPDPLQAKIASIILQANAQFELKIANRNNNLQAGKPGDAA
jgi:hypothetical protein